MAIVLFLEESEDQVIAGFPEFVYLSANKPATIFYTLDGSIPTEDSTIYVDKIVLPTTGKTTVLKAFAKSGIEYTSILERTWFTDQTALDRTRLTEQEGINLLPPDSVPVDHLSYDANGNIAQASSIPFQDLDLKGSTTNNRGEDIPGDTTLDFVNFEIKKFPSQKPPISTPNNNINFDPKAFYIIIDGTTKESQENQVVKIINRPHGTMDSVSPFQFQNIQINQLNTSNYVRHMINPATGQISFYYRDSRDNRWIRSTQKIEGKGLNLTATAGPPNSFVFRWIEHRTQSKIY
jgi:hypothetical protein